MTASTSDTLAAIREALAEQEQEPIYQLQLLNGNWIDQSKTSYEYNLRNGVVGLRVVYTHPAPANQRASVHAQELTRIADILRDCGKLVSSSGKSERALRAAASMLAAAPEAPAWQELSRDEACAIAHRRCTRYHHDPLTPMYTFTGQHLMDFLRDIRAKNGATK